MSSAWIEHEHRYEAIVSPFTEPLLKAAALVPGESVLDVGCGTGTTALAAADLVAPGGHVVGIDIDPALVARALSRATDRSAVTFITADAATIRLAPSVDVAISRFSTMLFRDLVAGHRNIAANLKPGGRFVAVVWREASRNLWHHLAAEAVHACVDWCPPAHDDGDGPSQGGPFSLADRHRLVQVLQSARFRQIEIDSLFHAVSVGRDIDDAIAFFEADTAATMRRVLPAETITAIIGRLRELLAPYARRDGVLVPGSAWVVRAVRA